MMYSGMTGTDTVFEAAEGVSSQTKFIGYMPVSIEALLMPPAPEITITYMPEENVSAGISM